MFPFKKKQEQPSFVNVVVAYEQLRQQVDGRLQAESTKLVRDLVKDGVNLAKIGMAVGRPKSYMAGVYNGVRPLTPRQFLAIVNFAARGAK